MNKERNIAIDINHIKHLLDTAIIVSKNKCKCDMCKDHILLALKTCDDILSKTMTKNMSKQV